MAEYPALDLTYPQNEEASELLELLYACLDDFEPASIIEHETGHGWRVFFRSAVSRDAALEALRTRHGGTLSSLAGADIEDDGWARRSQAQLTAVRVGRIVVAPPWTAEATGGARTPGSPQPGQDLVIVIEPSMGFGTGHHATTRLCLELLQREQVRGRRVIDIGTGSGVLALAAWKLGACAVTAVDCDADALQNARDNVRGNGAEDAVTLVEADVGVLEIPPADLVLANITGAALQRYAPTLRALTIPGGRAIVSGFAPGERLEVERAFEGPATDTAADVAWCAAAFTITSPPRLL